MKMSKNKNNNAIWALVFGLTAILMLAGYSKAGTVATFADPAFDASTPLFDINLGTGLITGGWDDSQTNLDLVVFGTTYNDVFFTMTDIAYASPIEGGQTGDGTIKFFEDTQDTRTTPLVQIDFDSAYITPYAFGGMDQFYGNGVVISGSAITNTISDESFSFSFTNHVPIGGDFANGFTATAAFTSSAIVVPEPSTIVMLGIGWLVSVSLKRKK